MSGLPHHETSLGLYKGPYAKRYKVWPPEGFKEPTKTEHAEVMRHRKWISLKRFTPEDLVRWLEVLDWFGREMNDRHTVDFLNTIRAELRKRGGPHYRSVRILRCGMCSHASERLWEATTGTHGITDQNDGPWTGFLCARCWSEYLNEEE